MVPLAPHRCPLRREGFVPILTISGFVRLLGTLEQKST